MKKTIQKMTILRADRSECNESEAQDMAGCLADGERVIAYFPTLSAMRHADLLAAAPELLIAAKNAANVLAALATGQLATVKHDSQALQGLRAAIVKAERGEA